MNLSAGTRIGPYEILSVIGAGGMGEVYRARDAKLNRSVAIKVLLPSVVADANRIARFQREAQVPASGRRLRDREMYRSRAGRVHELPQHLFGAICPRSLFGRDRAYPD